MNLMHMKFAAEVAKSGSINKAAENLYVAQPNLSRAIKELEVALGITIFERTSKGMVPTPAGEEFLCYANNILKQVEEVENLYKRGESRKQTFSISVPRVSYIASAFAEFSKKIDTSRPSEIFYKETNALRAIKNILEANYNLGIIRYAAHNDRYFKELLEEKGLHCELITEFKYRAIMSKEHPLANKEDITFSDLHGYTEIAHADPFVPSLPLSTIRKEELPPDIQRRIFVFERASQFELLAKNHHTYMWVSPVPDDIVELLGLVERECTDDTRFYRDVLIYHKDYKLSELDKEFITELMKSKKEYLG